MRYIYHLQICHNLYARRVGHYQLLSHVTFRVASIYVVGFAGKGDEYHEPGERPALNWLQFTLIITEIRQNYF